MLFFSGGGTSTRVPEKQYRAYLKLPLVFDPDQPLPCTVILVHSLRIVKALLYCQIQHPPTRDRGNGSSRSFTRKNLRFSGTTFQRCQGYLRRVSPAVPCPMSALRQETNPAMDDTNYANMYRYKQNTHCPFQDKELKRRIVALCTAFQTGTETEISETKQPVGALPHEEWGCFGDSSGWVG